MAPEFWHGKRVLVSGHTGFKGGWLSLWLQQLGANVLGFALEPPTEPNIFTLADIASGMQSVIGDIRNLDSLCDTFDAFKPEIVLHLAAQALVRESYSQPVETYSTNVMGTVNILEAARRNNSVRVVVNITTDKCYENKEWVWAYRENDPMGGHDPYSSSKGCAELVTAAYRSSFFSSRGSECRRIAVASARAGNVVGGGDWANGRLIPDFLKAIQKNIPLVLRNPNAIRPWQHVLEPLSGYLMLAERLWHGMPDFESAWNFGPLPDDARTVQWIVERLVELWGEGRSWRLDEEINVHEAQSLTLDSAKARSLLGWKQQWTLEQTLKSIVDWYKAHDAGQAMRIVTLAQINSYMKAH